MVDPLYVFLGLSLCYFIPILVAPGFSFDILPDSVFDSSMRSIENTIAMYATLSLTVPPLMDILLDLLSYKETKGLFIGYRFLSLLTIVVGVAVSLYYQHAENSASIGITMFSWGMNLEFSVVVSFMHYLIPAHFTIDRVIFLNCLSFLFMLTFVITPASSIPQLPIQILFYVLFYSYVGSFSIFSLQWIYSRLHDTPLVDWLWNLNEAEVGTLTMLVGLLIATIAYVIVIQVLVPTLPNVANLPNVLHVAVDVVRSFLCVITYIVPSRLLRAQLSAKTLSLEAKTEFVKYISHEVRSPLGSFLVGLQLLEKDLKCGGVTEKEDIVARVRDVYAPAEATLDILDDLLIYEKIERQEMTIEAIPLHPISTVSSILADFSSPIQIQEFQLPRETLRVNIDRLKLHKAISGILEYCSLDIPLQGLQVSFDCSRRDEGTPFAKRLDAMKHWRAVPRIAAVPMAEIDQQPWDLFAITLAINKPMLDLSIFTQLNSHFLKFARMGHADNSGSVVGLWIALKLIALHGGEVVALRDASGEGFRLRVTLPMFEMDPTAESGGGARYSVSVETTMHRRLSVRRGVGMKYAGLRVLIVDDSKIVRKITTQLMQSLRIMSAEAVDGCDAVEMMQRAVQDGVHYDLILMDNQMPRMMGTEATRIIRKQLLYTGLIFGVTGNVLDDDIKCFLAQGANQVILKPLTEEKFLEGLRLSLFMLNNIKK